LSSINFSFIVTAAAFKVYRNHVNWKNPSKIYCANVLQTIVLLNDRKKGGRQIMGEWQKKKAEAGQHITLHAAYNLEGTVVVRIEDAATGKAASAKFWSIDSVGGIEQLGSHTGSASFRVSGIKHELRAGGISKPTNFYIQAHFSGP
jgi:hypothetical protein